MRATYAFVCALALWVSASGCGDVQSCQEHTDLGCINTAPRPDNSCLFDLVLRGDKCVKRGGPDDNCSACPAGSLCVPEQNKCSEDFCAIPNALPGSVANPDPIFCEAFKQGDAGTANPMLSFTEVCNRRCRLRCERLAQFCPGYTCPAGACDQPDVQDKCTADCPLLASGGQDLACLTRSCNDARLQRCSSTVSCPNSIMPNCSAISCNNDCAFKVNGMAVVGDGICDDGDVLSSMSPYCPWGTDCADCGTRPGTTAPLPAAVGGLCEWSENCAGATGDPNTATSWCVGLTSTKVSRCMPDCSRGQACTHGFGCFNVTFTDPTTMMDAPVTKDGLTSSACIPLACQ